MKKIGFLSFIILLTFTFNANAQKIGGGIRAGLNVSTWGGDAATSFSDLLVETGVLSTEMKTGYHVGGFLSIPVSEHFSFEPGVYYSQKGISVKQTYFNNSLFKVGADITNTSHYIDVPVLAKVTIGKGFQVYAGPQVSYLVANDVKVEAGMFGLSYERDFDFNPGFREFDFGIAAGMGYQFANGLNFSAGYDHGLTTLDEGKSNVDIYNRVVKVSLGYKFGR